MDASVVSQPLDAVSWYIAYVRSTALSTFWAPGGSFSIYSLATSLLVAVGFLLWRRKTGRRPLRLKVLMRAVFPQSIVGHRSAAFDVQLFLLNTFVFTLLFGWAILSFQLVSAFVNGQLIGWFGAQTATTWPWLATAVVIALALFLAYEFGYWLDHYLSHAIPFLWEFHKVHHTAEVLTPLTNYRVHPGDTIVFYNVLALTMGTTEGVLNYLLGKPIAPLSLWSSNVFILAGTYFLEHLHHTQFWIPFTGIWGKIFLSPAHHQIHHSTNPIHFNRNMGSCLSIFDWMFGTLHIPSKTREKLVFGVDEDGPVDPHTWSEGLILPVVRAGGHLLPLLQAPARALKKLLPARTTVASPDTSQPAG
jgi:sterol desaturase/sphingolipid hydroxylase (fatty acid hydroxylase superfamily)